MKGIGQLTGFILWVIPTMIWQWISQLWLGASTKPAHKPGEVVYNRYDMERAKPETLLRYIKPTRGWTGNRWVISELWKTTKGNYVAVGYFWSP